MNLIRWSYAGRGRVRAYFEELPHSVVHLSRIRKKYFVRFVDWNKLDAVVSREDLQSIEKAVNEALADEFTIKNHE
ncbi:hypothetical protein JMA_18180 [Jeotgalibacillus malaysiensis]|uniref:Uncharacterized protein n=1 Tax=Jeotgalibacillus malaysiensis TaxID=1508404 RepID=A0A0B5ALI1_9BACL|nr:hypothetical protein [Jeotgalibacillus malaysiensis]AJD91135.1 hypothetical protein JMA_18180 [Jeotgalibacillus malaysiensis]